jgi:hypothetical protein
MASVCQKSITLFCDACQSAVDVIAWSRHQKTKDHVRKQEEYDEKRRTQLRIRRLERECELRRDHTPEVEIQSILEREESEAEEEYESKQREASYAEIEAQERRKLEDTMRREEIQKKLKLESAAIKKKQQLKEARILVKEMEKTLRQLLEENASPNDDRWMPLKKKQENVYTSNFTDCIEGALWDDAYNYKHTLSNIEIDYNCSTHIPIYYKG